MKPLEKKDGTVKIVVITGSTRGIGYALSDAFLARGCAVVLCGRRKESLEDALRRLGSKHSDDRVAGWICDVRQEEQLQALWEQAVGRFGRIDIWINNAGVAHSTQRIWEQTSDLPRSVLETNLLGAIFGSRVAARGMLAQGSGSIFNMEGLGSDGRRVSGLVYYGTSKCGLRYFNQCLIEDARGTPLTIGILRPGMVMTDMITGQYADRPGEWERARRVFEVLADRPEPVASWLVERILRNRKPVVLLRYVTPSRIAARMLRRLARRGAGEGTAAAPMDHSAGYMAVNRAEDEPRQPH